MLESVRKYLLTCDLLNDNGKLGIEYLDNEPINYSIEEGVGYNPILETYLDTSSRRQFLFSLTSREYFGQDEVEQNIANSKFYEDFYNWLETNTFNGILPELEEDKTAESIKALSSGYLFSVDDGMKVARYKIQCQLIYEKKGIDSK